jgi:tetratricopeptide (TPR) repeat protein
MKTAMTTWCVFLALLVPAVAQGNETPTSAKTETRVTEATAEKPVRAKVQLTEAGRAALASAKDVAGRCKGLRAAERTQALEQAAAAYDKVAADFATEPAVAGAAAFAAAELWRQHGSFPLAEKDYLLAAETDGPRFGQRALMGAADMQRRQKRNEEAMVIYGKAAALEAGTPRAQEARLWQARLLQTSGRLDEAVTSFQSALESARPGRPVIDAANYLALALVQKGDFDAAERAIAHAEQALGADEDPIVAERLKKAIESMSARKALQRARDKATRAAKDAVGLEAAQKRNAG